MIENYFFGVFYEEKVSFDGTIVLLYNLSALHCGL